jgi:2-amino-4-hydroxy-6-hydroxymethyldihydropteridine diphosphokinase
MAVVYFSLGSNEGDRLNWLVKATELIDNLIGKVMQNSSVILSEPWGFKSETSFYNLVLSVKTDQTPHQVLTKLLEIEASLGRIRHGKLYTNRTIDIDILFFNNEKINEASLVIPHPLLHLRKFVLQPLAEIAPDFIHPVFNLSTTKLLQQLNDPIPISKVIDCEEFASLLNPINQN